MSIKKADQKPNKSGFSGPLENPKISMAEKKNRKSL